MDVNPSPGPRPLPIAGWLAGAAVFLGAVLVFVVQPMVAKPLLAWYGGAPMVWAVALFFFQAALLLGYLGAHLLVTRLRPRVQRIAYAAILLLALVTLPPLADAGWAPDGGEAPAGRILLTLLASVGLPFVVAAATTPLLSAWVAASRPGGREGDPGVYRLYALSNAGSLIGLGLYPVLLEPFSGLAQQGRLWSAGFALWLVASIAAGWFTLRGTAEPASPARGTAGGFQVAPAGLAAMGSLVLVAVTTHLTRDVAAAPFLWTVPLAVYLLTFILAFRGGPPYPRRLLPPLVVAAAIACLAVWFQDITYGLDRAPLAHATAGILFLFTAGWALHGEIAHRKPAPARLTGFYLSVTAGGAAGGLAASLASPLLFPNLWEYPLALALAPAAVLIARGQPRIVARLALAGTAGLAIAVAALEHQRPLVSGRNFFGVVRVMEANPDTPDWRRDLWHGGIGHGTQFLDPARRREPTLYYYDGTGIAAAVTRHPKRAAGLPMRVGVVGLGAGSLAVYGERGDHFRFYEIDPQVEERARTHFTYLEDTPAEVDVVLGDGRLSLAREVERAEPGWDLLVLDAFSGDAIPVHLLTAEAFDLYRRRLAPGGVLAVHISNRHVDLAPVVRTHARRLDLMSLLTVSEPDQDRLRYTATWILLSENSDFITDPAVLGRAEPWAGDAADPRPGHHWTDDYSNLLGVLR